MILALRDSTQKSRSETPKLINKGISKMARSKIVLIGSGQIGGTLAHLAAIKGNG